MKVSHVVGPALLGACLYGAVTNSYPTDAEKDAVGDAAAANAVEQAGVAALLGLRTTLGLTEAEIIAAIRAPHTVSQTPPEAARNSERQPWNLRGAWDDDFYFGFSGDWVFPRGSNHLAGVLVHSQGDLSASSYELPFAALPLAVAMVPGESSFATEFTTSNSYAFTWTQVRPGRLSEEKLDARIELFRNGNYTVSTNDCVTEQFVREPPFPHIGIGQDDDWVRASFTNAADILSVGYANWVDAQVGNDLTNGLYKFTATFPNDPPEATELIVGDLSVCVTNAGEYVFVLEKGVEYDFGTDPYDATVEYSMQDDLMDAPVFANWWWGDGNGVWTVDGDWHELYLPWLTYLGSCYWEPKFRGAPDVTNLSTADFPMTFTALLTDCCHTNGVTYHWTTDDEKVYIASPYSQTTRVEIVSCFDAETFSLSVEAYAPDRTYYSTLTSDISTNDLSGLSFSMTAPEVVFLNDDDRTSRWYRVAFELSSSIATNATVSFANHGQTGIRYASDSSGCNPIPKSTFPLHVMNGQNSCEYQLYFACTNVSDGTLEATCLLEGGKTLVRHASYKVIEPLRRLVSNSSFDYGHMINPCRLVPGMDAWLEVDQRGSFPRENIKWQVVSGPGEIVRTNQFRACVRATAGTGTVVVEAAFGSDALFQPRFVLPITEKKRVPIYVYYVEDQLGCQPMRMESLNEEMDLANQIFSQIGIELFHGAEVQPIADANYSRLPERGVVVDTNGRRRLSQCISPHVWNLIRMLPQTNEAVRVVYVPEITHGTSIAFSVAEYKLIVMGADGSSLALAHELGHVFGLEDIYSRRKREMNFLMPGWHDQAYQDIFADVTLDWGKECGRAFYEALDAHGQLIDTLLMNGIDGFGGMDIPSGNVLGYPPNPINAFDIRSQKVGADSISRGLR